MIEQHAPPGVVGIPASSPGSTDTSFTRWLEGQLVTRRHRPRDGWSTPSDSTTT